MAEEPTIDLPKSQLPVVGNLDVTIVSETAAVEDTGMRSSPPGYKILRELGRGGMGVVYQARHTHLNRVVALKMILAGDHATDNSRSRFLAEAEIIAGLQHPHIVQIYEFGRHNGLPYFSLEFCSQGSLEARLKGEPQSPRSAAQMMAKLASAVQLAHSKHVIHRDLKPANVLLDAAGEPKVTDFGLAKAGDSGQTASGMLIGTPSYMSPEQAAGEASRVGPAADIWALGAILYETLTGRPPFRGSSLAETITQVRTVEPVAVRALQPSVPRDLETICHKCLQKDATCRYASAQALADDLQAFLNGRPITARPVSPLERLWRWARRNPVISLLIVSLLAVMGLAGLLCAGYAAIAEFERSEANRLRELAEQRATEAAQQADAARQAAAQADLSALNARAANEKSRRLLYASNMNLIQRSWEDNSIANIQALLEQYKPGPGDTDLRGFEWYYWLKQLNGERLRIDFHGSAVNLTVYPDEQHFAVVGSYVDDERQVPGKETKLSGMIKVYDSRSGKLTAERKDLPQPVYAVAISPDGRLLVTVGRGNDLQLWDARTLVPQATIPIGPGSLSSVTFSPDGSRLAITSSRSMTYVVDLKTQKLVHNLQTFDNSTGSLILQKIGYARELPFADTFEPVSARGYASYKKLLCAAFSPDGRYLVSGGSTENLLMWDLQTGRLVRQFLHSGGVRGPHSVGDLRFDESGNFVIGACIRQVQSRLTPILRVWEAGTGQLVQEFAGQPSTMTENRLLPIPYFLPNIDGPANFAFHPNGRTLAIGAFDKRVQLIQVRGFINQKWKQTTELKLQGFRDNILRLDFLRGGNELVTIDSGGVIRTWDLTTQEPRLISGSQGVVNFDISADGRTIVSLGKGKAMAVWDLPSERRRHLLEDLSRQGAISSALKTGGIGLLLDFTLHRELVLSPDGTEAASIVNKLGNWMPELAIWDTTTGQLKPSPSEQVAERPENNQCDDVGGGGVPASDFPHQVCYHPDGSLWQAREDKLIWVDRKGKHLELSIPQGFRTAIHNRMAISPDGSKVVCSGSLIKQVDDTKAVIQPSYLVYDIASKQMVRSIPALRNQSVLLMVSPQSDRLIVASQSGNSENQFTLYNLHTGEEIFGTLAHSGGVKAVAWHPSGTRIATGGDDGIRLWDTSNGRELLRLTEVNRPATSLKFSLSGEQLYAAQDGIRVYDVRPKNTLANGNSQDQTKPVP